MPSEGPIKSNMDKVVAYEDYPLYKLIILQIQQSAFEEAFLQLLELGENTEMNLTDIYFTIEDLYAGYKEKGTSKILTEGLTAVTNSFFKEAQERNLLHLSKKGAFIFGYLDENGLPTRNSSLEDN